MGILVHCINKCYISIFCDIFNNHSKRGQNTLYLHVVLSILSTRYEFYRTQNMLNTSLMFICLKMKLIMIRFYSESLETDA